MMVLPYNEVKGNLLYRDIQRQPERGERFSLAGGYVPIISLWRVMAHNLPPYMYMKIREIKVDKMYIFSLMLYRWKPYLGHQTRIFYERNETVPLRNGGIKTETQLPRHFS